MKPPGTPCRITMDLDEPDSPEPVVGSTIETRTGRAAYLVTDARRVNSTVHPRRWKLRCVRLDPAELDDPDFVLHWYPRGRR